MALVKEVRGKSPTLGEGCYLAENSTIIGDVTLGNDCSIWFGVVLRGDVNAIKIGNRVNIQDNTTVHCTYEKSITEIEDDASIGHNAIIHGCKVKKGALIGMGSVVMDNAVVGESSIVAAGAVVTENTIIPPRTIWAGIPAKQVKSISEAMAAKMKTSEAYLKYKEWYN